MDDSMVDSVFDDGDDSDAFSPEQATVSDKFDISCSRINAADTTSA